MEFYPASTSVDFLRSEALPEALEIVSIFFHRPELHKSTNLINCLSDFSFSTIQNKRLNCSEYRDKDTVYYHANWPLSPREVEEAKYFVVSIIIKNIIGSTPVKEVFYPESIGKL